MERLTLATQTIPDLIEREETLARAAESLHRTRAGRGSVLFLEGSAGLGRTAVLAAVREHAAENGMQVLAGAGHRHEQQYSLGVVMQLLETRLASAAPKERERLLSDAARQALPLFTSEPGRGFSRMSFELLHGLYRLCANLAAIDPVLIALDDADLADAASLRFLLYLTERTERLPLSVIVTAGTVSPHEAPPLLGEIARHRSTLRLTLAPLSPAGTRTCIRSDWFESATDDVCRVIHDSTAGNPFLIEQACSELAGSGPDSLAAAARTLAPPVVRDWALARARAVDERAPGLLVATAALGGDSELRHVAAIAGIEDEPAMLLVDRLVGTGMLKPGRRPDFAQPLVGAALEDTQPDGERANVHLKVARLLDAEDASPEDVARHLRLAPARGSRWAVERLCSAAAVALGRGLPADAVDLLTRALEEPPPRDLRAHVVLELGRAEATAGEPPPVVYLNALDQPPPARRTRTALDTGRTLFALGKPRHATIVLERALERAGEGDEGLTQRLKAAHAAALWLTRPGEPLDPGLAPESADTPGDRALLALYAMESALRGTDHEQAIDFATRALSRGRLLDDETADGITYYLAAGALALAGDLQTAEAALTAAVEDARSRGSVLGFATASHVRGRAILMRGRVQDAAADARHALAVERHGWRLGLGSARLVLANSLVEAGDVAGAERHLRAAEGDIGRLDHARLDLLVTRGRMRALAGDQEAALADFLACGELEDGVGIKNPAFASWRSDAGLTCSALGDVSEGEQLAETELALAERFGAPGPIGRALRALGSIRGPERGLEALEAAVARLESSQNALERARSLVDYGAALRRTGRRRDAREPLLLGLDLAERCAADALALSAKRELKVAGARPRRTAVHGLDALTARERQVAGLAAEGYTNREIAETLVVTIKTVEWHLKHTYRKLGVSSRHKLRDLLGSHDH